MYPNGTVGNKSHVSIFLENKSNEPLHISEVVFTFQASGAAPLTWNAPKKELESEDDWGFQRSVIATAESKILTRFEWKSPEVQPLIRLIQLHIL